MNNRDGIWGKYPRPSRENELKLKLIVKDKEITKLKDKLNKTKHNYVRKNGYWECTLCGDNFVMRGSIGIGDVPDSWKYCEDMKNSRRKVMEDVKSKYIIIEEIASKTKTKRFVIRNNNSQQIIGTVNWYGAWRQYCFSPAYQTIWNNDCLNIIKEFLDNLKKE